MKCDSCGHENREDARFCEDCGEVLPVEAPPPAPGAKPEPSGVMCAACGTRNRPGMRFCEQCAAPLVVSEPAPPDQRPRRRRVLVIAGLATGFLLLGLVAVGMVLGPGVIGGRYIDLPNVGEFSDMTEEEAAVLGTGVIEELYPEFVDPVPVVGESVVQGHRIYDVIFSTDVAGEGGGYRWVVIVSIDTDTGQIAIFESD